MHVAPREARVVVVAVVGVHAQRHVPSPAVQPAVRLQHAPCTGALAVGQVHAVVVVHHEAVFGHGVYCVFRQGVGHIEIGVVSIGGRCLSAVAVAGREGDAGSEHDVGHRVGCPLQAEPSVPGVAPGVVLAQAVAERLVLRHEVLARCFRVDIAVAVVPSQAGVHFQLVLLLEVVVQTYHLGGVQSLLSPAPSSASESAVVGVVGVGEEHDSVLVVEVGAHQSFGVSSVCAYGGVDVGEHAVVHALFQCEVEHGFLLAVVDAGHASQVAFLVIALYLVHNRGGQVFQCRLRVAGHEFLSVHAYLLHLLAVDGYLSVVAHLCARQFLHQFLDGRALRHAVGRRVVDEGVFFEHHLGRMSRGGHGAQHDGVGAHHDVAQPLVFVVAHGQVAEHVGISHAGDAEYVLAVFSGLQPEVALIVADGARHKRAVCFEQLQCGLRDGLFAFLVGQPSRDESLLCHCRRRHGDEAHQHKYFSHIIK